MWSYMHTFTVRLLPGDADNTSMSVAKAAELQTVTAISALLHG